MPPHSRSPRHPQVCRADRSTSTSIVALRPRYVRSRISVTSHSWLYRKQANRSPLCTASVQPKPGDIPQHPYPSWAAAAMRKASRSLETVSHTRKRPKQTLKRAQLAASKTADAAAAAAAQRHAVHELRAAVSKAVWEGANSLPLSDFLLWPEEVDACAAMLGWGACAADHLRKLTADGPRDGRISTCFSLQSSCK